MFLALEPHFRSLATFKLVSCSECCRRYGELLNRKEQLRRRTVSLRQHGFLVYLTYAQTKLSQCSRQDCRAIFVRGCYCRRLFIIIIVVVFCSRPCFSSHPCRHRIEFFCALLRVFSSFHELMQSRGVRRPSVCLSVCPSVCKLLRKSLLLPQT